MPLKPRSRAPLAAAALLVAALAGCERRAQPPPRPDWPISDLSVLSGPAAAGVPAGERAAPAPEEPAPREAQASGPARDPALTGALRALVDQAREQGLATVEGDHGRALRLALPAAVDAAGGEAAFLQALRQAAAERERSGTTLLRQTPLEPSRIVPAGDVLYAVVPVATDARGADGRRWTQQGLLLAASEDGGARWRFVDGGAVDADPARLDALLPGFPRQLLPRR